MIFIYIFEKSEISKRESKNTVPKNLMLYRDDTVQFHIADELRFKTYIRLVYGKLSKNK